MQTSAAATTSSRCCSCVAHDHAEQSHGLRLRFTAAPARRKPARAGRAVATRTQAFAGAAAVAGSAAGLKGLSNLAAAAGVVLGAWWLSRELTLEQDVSKGDNQGTECPTCDGTGYTECFCTRWSDGDVGCSSCRGSGKMPCNSCGGSGTGRPITANLIVERER